VAKTSGLGDNFYVDGYDLSGDTNSLSSVSGGNSPIVVTGINKSAMERIGGRRDGAMSWTSYFNPTLLTGAHARYSTLPTTDIVASYFRGTSLGDPSASIVAKQIGYDGNRADDGAFTLAVEAQANGYGLEWGKSLTAGQRTDTTATNGTSVDFGTGSTAFGLQAYLHVFAFTGTSVTVKLQESSDNGAGDAFADVTGGAFTAATGITSQRIATASGQTVERYLRIVTTGTFSNATFAVSVARNDTAVTF
jgi:hypothetical protein